MYSLCKIDWHIGPKPMETSTRNQWKYPSKIVRKSIEIWSGNHRKLMENPIENLREIHQTSMEKSTPNRWKQSNIDGKSYRNRWRIQSKMSGNIHTKAMGNAPNVDGKIHTQWNRKSINSINKSKEHQWKNPPKIIRKSTPNSKKQPKNKWKTPPKTVGSPKEK